MAAALPTLLSFNQEACFPYLKLREEFGRQPRFLRDHHRIHCNIQSNRMIRKKFRRYRLLDKGVQAVKHKAETPMNTIRRPYIGIAFMHEEGGWPRDINLTEQEMMIRHRKKLEKEENYQICMPVMTEKMEYYLKQNNAVDLYGELFPKKWKHRDPHRKTPHAKTIQIFRDWTYMKRAVKKIIWAPDNVGRMGVCHTPRKYDRSLRDTPTEAYFWEVENASRPESMVRSGSHIMDIMYHPKDMHSLCGACFDGTVQFWDARIGPNVQLSSPLEVSHGDVCSTAHWINSKANTEFISAGLDGKVMWWDVRNMDNPLDTTFCDPEKGQQREEAALGASILEYEHTLPTKFIIGTEDGRVLIFMKKGKTPNDKLANCLKGHRGPVLALERNPMFIKNFLSCGDTNVRIFAEDVRDSSIMWTAPQNVRYTHAAWVPSRPSIFVVSRNDGHFDVYDLNKNPARPFTKVKVRVAIDPKRQFMSDLYLTYVAPCDAPSRLLAVGTSKGQIYMQRMSEVLYRSEKFDKPVLAAAFERESRREKLIEQRFREIRLRKRDKEKATAFQENIQKERDAFKEKILAEEQATGVKQDLPDYSKNKKYDLVYEAKHDPRCVTEREFYIEIEKELQEKGIDSWPEYRAVADEDDKMNEDGPLDVDAALDVTAADLAQFANDDEDDELNDDYDDDGRPIEKKKKKSLDQPPPPPKPTPSKAEKVAVPTGAPTLGVPQARLDSEVDAEAARSGRSPPEASSTEPSSTQQDSGETPTSDETALETATDTGPGTATETNAGTTAETSPDTAAVATPPTAPDTAPTDMDTEREDEAAEGDDEAEE